MNVATALITGGSGMLAHAITAVLRASGGSVVALPRSDLDVTDQAAVKRTLDRVRPRVVFQCAAYTRVDDAEANQAAAFAVNAEGAAIVARACREFDARLVFPSTDYVFDGATNEPYSPEAPPRPLNVYGRSKAAGEEAAREAGDFLIVRTSWLYGASGRNFVGTVLEKLRTGATMLVVHDQRGSPTWTMDLAARLIGLVQCVQHSGVYHLTNAGVASWYELAVETARLVNLEPRIQPCTTDQYAALATRPRFSVLDCSAADALLGPARPWRDALMDAIRSGEY